MNGVEFRDGADSHRVDKVKIVACDGKAGEIEIREFFRLLAIPTL